MDEQIFGILAAHEAGARCAELYRRHGMPEGTFNSWKARIGGMTVSVGSRLTAPEDEYAKLKKRLPSRCKVGRR